MDYFASVGVARAPSTAVSNPADFLLSVISNGAPPVEGDGSSSLFSVGVSVPTAGTDGGGWGGKNGVRLDYDDVTVRLLFLALVRGVDFDDFGFVCVRACVCFFLVEGKGHAFDCIGFVVGFGGGFSGAVDRFYGGLIGRSTMFLCSGGGGGEGVVGLGYCRVVQRMFALIDTIWRMFGLMPSMDCLAGSAKLLRW